MCEAAEVACEDVLEHEQTGALPSLGALARMLGPLLRKASAARIVTRLAPLLWVVSGGAGMYAKLQQTCWEGKERCRVLHTSSTVQMC